MKNVRIFLSKNFHFFFFLLVKNSVYLNRLVFVMRRGITAQEVKLTMGKLKSSRLSRG